MRSKKIWTTIEGDASAASHDNGARNAIETFWSRPSFGDARYWHEKCDWKFFQVDQALEMLRVPLVTILAREMRLKFFSSRPSFGDVANAACHDIGARNAIEIFWSRPMLEMLRVPLVTILAREMRLKVFSTISRTKLPITWQAALGKSL